MRKTGKEEHTILECMCDIVERLRSDDDGYPRSFDRTIFKEEKSRIAVLCDRLEITPMQAVLLSVLVEYSQKAFVSMSDIATVMGMPYIRLLSHKDDFRALSDRKYIRIDEEGGIHLRKDALDAFSENRARIQTDYSGLTDKDILKNIHRRIRQRMEHEISLAEMTAEIDCIMEANTGCGLVRGCREIGIYGNCRRFDVWDKAVFYYCLDRHMTEGEDQASFEEMYFLFDNETDVSIISSCYRNGSMVLKSSGIIEPVNEDGMKSMEYFHITDEVMEKLIPGSRIGHGTGGRHIPGLKTLACTDIPAKAMFYNQDVETMIFRLERLLGHSQFTDICDRLKEKGLRTGFTCLFYGAPGTGKTETVYQIARKTGRDLIPVNAPDIKSSLVGESEKQMKRVFDKYSAAVSRSSPVPILLFNEADAIFGIRREGSLNAADKMENGIQNILLQEMESLQGILIATTNLTNNLDPAFERRFLYKINFTDPGPDVKAKIWQSMMPRLSPAQVRQLSISFDLSGGQIENISRKCEVCAILENREPGFAEIIEYCREETIVGRSYQHSIGFKV